jgi:hypothetical protein
MPICENCGEAFPARRSDARYCSSRCTVAAFSARERVSITPVRQQHVIDRPTPSQVIEGAFREVPSPSIPTSTSRALVPMQGSAQPFDSRTEAALRQHARAQRRPWREY